MKIIFKTLALTVTLTASSAFAQSALDIERSGMEPDRAPTTATESLLRGQQRGIALSTGLLLIPESTNDRVMAFDPQTGDLVDADFIPADATNLSTPIHAILSSNGQSILVSDQVEDVVQQYDLDGNYLGVFAPAGGVDNAILDNIRGISLESSTGNLLVTVGGGANDDAIAEFDPAGNHLGNRVANGAGGLDSPFDVFDDGSGFLVSGITSDAIHAYLYSGTSAGTVAAVNTFPEQIQTIPGGFLVANFSGTQEGVIEFDATGAVVGVYDPPSLAGYRGVFELPNGNILTTNGGGVHEIDRLGNLVETKISGVSARFIERIQIAPPTNTTNCALLTQADIGGSTDITLSGDAVSDFTVIYNGTTFDNLPAGVFTLPSVVGDVQNVTIRANGTINGSPGFDQTSCNIPYNLPTCAATQDPDSSVSPVDVGTVVTLALASTNAVSTTVDSIPMTPDADPDTNFSVAWSATHVAVADTVLTGESTSPDGGTVECTWAIDVNNAPPTAPVITNPPPGASVLIQGLPTDELVPAWTASTDPDDDPVTYTWELGSDASFSTVLLSIPTGTETDVTLTLEAIDLLLSANGVNVGDSITLFHRATASDGTSSAPGPAAEVTFTLGIVDVPAVPVPLFSPAALAILILLILAAASLASIGKAGAARPRH